MRVAPILIRTTSERIHVRYRTVFLIAVLDNPGGALWRRIEVEDFGLESSRPIAERHPHILNHFYNTRCQRQGETETHTLTCDGVYAHILWTNPHICAPKRRLTCSLHQANNGSIFVVQVLHDDVVPHLTRDADNKDDFPPGQDLV